MRQFLFPRRPLARSTLLTCHLLLQLGLVIGVALWLVPRTPLVSPVAWVSVLPTLVLGIGAWLLTAIGLRLLAELWLLPYHLSNLRPGFTSGAVITRSFERRPAVHDEDDSWTSEARPVDTDTGVVGSARVRRPAERLRPHAANHDPSLDLSDPDSLGTTTSHREPRL